ncbi:MAG: HDOD domain-containing protein [Deltaproteobacteria bacterium]|nr:HDOD domain-containing protein [Deltaproteobacteria bacterium]
MNRDELRAKIFSKIDELPTLPDVVPKVLDAMEGARSNAMQVTEIIARDPALTSKILRVANSAYYGFPQEIADLERAVTLLGFSMVRSLAVSMGVMQSLGSARPSSRFPMEGLWMHSLAVATAIKALARRCDRSEGGEQLFVIGLLHDIGKVVMDQFFADLFEEALEKVEHMEPPRLYVAERAVIGFDHGEVGAMLLKRWMFPETIVNPIGAHHQEGVPRGTDPVDLALLRVSDALPQSVGLGDRGSPSMSDICKDDMQVLGVETKDLESLQALLEEAREGIEAFFSAIR